VGGREDEKVRTGEDATRGNHRSKSIIDRTLSKTAMSLEAARGLPILELLRVLNEKLCLECTELRKIPLPPVTPAPLLESEVSTHRLVPIPTSA